MTNSRGSITIVDISDLGEFSVYPKVNSSRTQIYNVNDGSFIPNWNAAGSNLIITPAAYYNGIDVSNSVESYTWTRRDGAGQETNLLNGETAITDKTNINYGRLTVNQNMLALNGSSGTITYILTAVYNVDNISLTAVGEIDFTLIKQGSNAKIAKITGRNVFKYDSYGYPTPRNDFIVLTGAISSNIDIIDWYYLNSNGSFVPTHIGSYNTISINPQTNVISYGNNFNSNVTINDLFNNDVATFKLVTSDDITFDTFTITKIRDGAPGEKAVSATLTNENQMIPFDNSEPPVGDFSSAISRIIIYEGGLDVTPDWTITQTYTNVVATASATTVTNDTVSVSSFLNNAFTGTVTFRCSQTDYDDIIKTFHLTKVSAGANGETPIIYSIETDTYAFNKRDDGFNPTSVTFYAYKTDENGKLPYSGRIQFFDEDGNIIDNNGNIGSEDLVNRTSKVFTPNTDWNKRIIVKLYGENRLIDYSEPLDSQSVGLTYDGASGKDGEAGVGAVAILLDNENDVISCNSKNQLVNNYVINTNFVAYIGTERKPVRCTSAPALNVSEWGGSSNINPTVVQSTFDIDGSISYVIDTTRTIPESGTITFTFTIYDDYENGNFKKILASNIVKTYSWSRNTAAKDSIILQLTTPNGNIFSNNDGVLTIKGTLWEGNNEINNSEVVWRWYFNNTEIVSTNINDNIYKNNVGDILTVKAAAVESYGTFKCEAVYGETYLQYVSLIDKFDPLQVSIHSTIGTQIKSNTDVGAVYARVTQNNIMIDEIPEDIEASINLPTNPYTGMMFIHLFTSNNNKIARLKKYNGSSWQNVQSSCKYEWIFKDENGNILSNIYQDTNNLTNNQCIYIDTSLINEKTIIDLKITLD